jgi:hypothetical protein
LIYFFVGSIDGDPATTTTFSGATAVDAVATYVSQSAITFNHNDGIGYPASTALHPAAAATTATTHNAATAFDHAASGCQPATADGSGDTEPEPPTATNAAPSQSADPATTATVAASEPTNPAATVGSDPTTTLVTSTELDESTDDNFSAN